MKHFSQYLFACTLLLGALILFNVQKDESVTLASEIPEMEHAVLEAEVCSNQTASSTVLSIRHFPVEAFRSISGKLSHFGYLNSAEHSIRCKRQILIHLELKPFLSIQSGLNLHHRLSYDDPPLS